MSDFRQLVKNEYLNAYDLSLQKNYSKPAIYDANGDLSKRWYVYYSFRNPLNDKLERQNPIYLGVNKFKEFKERSKAIKILRQAVQNILEGGYNPYKDAVFSTEYTEMLIFDAFLLVRDLKKNTMALTSYKDFKSRINQFEKWLNENGFKNRYITSVNKKAVIYYLNEVQKKSSPKNRNNTRSAIQTFFQTLEDNEIIPANFVNSINVLTSKPERNKTYTIDQELMLFDYLDKTKPNVLLFVKFICYGMLRPIEICRLQVKDLNLTENKMYIRAKNKAVKTKIIPEILLLDLPDLSLYRDNDFVFTRDGFGGSWSAQEDSKRQFFTEQFKEAKDNFNLDKNYTMYSFRHTFITKLYVSLRKNHTPFEAKSKAMLVTGHNSMSAFEKYLRDIDAELPEDFSSHFKSC
jgi:integrase